MLIKFNEKDNGKIGNKAKFLIEMKSNGFNIPNGIVLDSDTYTQIIKSNKIDNSIENLIKELNKDNVKEISKKILKLFDNVKIEDSIKNEINANIDSCKNYAVRSSGTKEDLENFSFAGQYETFLNISGIDNIEKSIIACYKSMFSEVLLGYLINNNIELDNLKMSVIIQEMVNSDYSGICFTVNPVTGEDKTMLIEVAKGLGENIVSGKVAPEQYYYNWYEEKGTIGENNKILTSQKLEQMAKEFLKIQIYFGYPCDIEFAIQNDELYILQARKITSIKYLGIKDMWSTADFKDGGVSASICTPYMWSLYEYIWEFTLRKFILDSKILKEKDVNKKLGDMFYARCYWNMSVVKHGMSQVVGYKEREFDSEYGVKINYEGDGETTKASLKTIIHILQMALAQKKILNERNKNAENYKQDLLNKYNNYKDKYDKKEITDIRKTWYELTKKIYLQSESTYFWQIFINTIHQSLYKDNLLKYVSESDYLSLLGSIENISHLLPFYDMWDVTRKIRNDKESYKYWKEKSVEELIKNINSTENKMLDVKEIIDKYGYHSDKELDVTYPCYYEDIKPIIINIKDMINLEDNFSPVEDKKRGKEIYEKILESISKQVSPSKMKKIKTKVENMRKMLWWREEFRDISTRFYYIIRIYTIELAKQFKKEEIIENIEDIWFLKVGQIWDFIDGKLEKEALKEIINKNKEYYNSFRNYLSENEIGSIFSIGNDSKDDNTSEKTQIKGLGANNGIVTGTARVIEDFSQIDRLQEHDILVTKFTDTGWTPKFAILSGIVTEYGGILCHAAIVSREYGIPAIVSCHSVMNKIKDGMKITIDGTTGIVKIEE